MLQEVNNDCHYSIEIIDSKLLALNQLAGSPLLPNDVGSNASGSMSNLSNTGGGGRLGSMANQSDRGSFTGGVSTGRYESFASGGHTSRRGTRLLSNDSDDMHGISRSDMLSLQQVG